MDSSFGVMSLKNAPNPLSPQTRVMVGILAEHVVLRDAEHPSKSEEYILTESIRLLDIGPSCLNQFLMLPQDLCWSFI
jgi:hypothetical protein